MIIAITRDNENLINSVCNTLGLDVQIITGVTNLKRFAIQEMRNLNNYSNIIIDLIGLSDTEEDIVDAVVALKSMYSIRITIIAAGYQYGNSLLAKLFNEGIYNFVTTIDIREQEKELIQCIDGNGKQYKDSVRYRNTENISSGDKIIIKKEYKKLKQCVTIAIAGTENHIGVTTQAIAITKFLNNLQMNACYIQANQKQDIETLESLFDVEVKEGFITFNGIDFYTKDKTVNAIEYGYDFYIYDMGNFNDISDIDNFITKDVKIIVSGTKSWEQDNLMLIFDKLEIVNDINYIFNFAPELQKNEITENMGKLGIKTFFSNYIPDPFIVENETEYQKILSDYIAEKSIKTEVIPIQKKKGFLTNLMERRNK